MSKEALIIVDMQNDSCHENGVFNKHGLTSSPIQSILPNILSTIDFCKKNKIPILATQFTILEDLDKNAIGLGSFQSIRSFLEREGFRENTWGHQLLDELYADYKIKKWGISAFYQTDFGKYLEALKISNLILMGFTTSGPLETLAREALGRNFEITILTDCVANYSIELQKASLTTLRAFGKIKTSKEWIEQFKT